LLHEVAAHLGNICVDQTLGDRARHATIADSGAVEAARTSDAEARGPKEHLVGVRSVEQVDVTLKCWNRKFAREIGSIWRLMPGST
jgi:hypothetical protein